MATQQFNESVRHEIETDIVRDQAARSAILLAGINSTGQTAVELETLINARLDVWPYGQERPDLTNEQMVALGYGRFFK